MDIVNFIRAQSSIPLGDHRVGFVIEINSDAYFGEAAKPLSQKIIENINRSSSENFSHTSGQKPPRSA